MDVKEAIKLAKVHLSNLYDDEHIRDVGLEEISQEGYIWAITLGFARDSGSRANNFSQVLADISNKRVYKIIRIDGEGGQIISMKNRD